MYPPGFEPIPTIPFGRQWWEILPEPRYGQPFTITEAPPIVYGSSTAPMRVGTVHYDRLD